MPRTTSDHLQARGLLANTARNGDHNRPLTSSGPLSTTTKDGTTIDHLRARGPPSTTSDHLLSRELLANTSKDGDDYRPLASSGPISTTTKDGTTIDHLRARGSPWTTCELGVHY